METSTVVVILVLCLASAGAYYLIHQVSTKGARDAYEAAPPLSVDAGVKKVGGKFLNRDGSPATVESINKSLQASGTNPIKFWLQKA